MRAPYEALRSFIKERLGKEDGPLSQEDVIHIEQHFGLSRHATLVRLLRERYLSEQQAEKMRANIIITAKQLGYDPMLYLPTPEERQYATYGRYVSLAQQIKEKGLISQGKYEELLLDGFRHDLVYGTNNGEERYD